MWSRLDFPAGLAKELDGVAHVVTEERRLAADRIAVLGGEHLRRHQILHLVEDFQFPAFGQPGGGKLGAVEIAVDALVLAEEGGAVQFLEIEDVVQRLAQFRVLELLARMLGTKPTMMPEER